MTVTTSLKNQVASLTDTNLDLPKMDPTKWLYRSDAKVGRRNQTNYAFAEGAGDPTLLEITAGPQVVDKELKQSGQLKLIVPLLSIDDVTTVVTRVGTCEFWQGFSVTAHNSMTAAVVAKWKQQLFSVAFPTITAGVADASMIDKLLFGSSKLY